MSFRGKVSFRNVKPFFLPSIPLFLLPNWCNMMQTRKVRNWIRCLVGHCKRRDRREQLPSAMKNPKRVQVPKRFEVSFHLQDRCPKLFWEAKWSCLLSSDCQTACHQRRNWREHSLCDSESKKKHSVKSFNCKERLWRLRLRSIDMANLIAMVSTLVANQAKHLSCIGLVNLHLRRLRRCFCASDLSRSLPKKGIARATKMIRRKE